MLGNILLFPTRNQNNIPGGAYEIHNNSNDRIGGLSSQPLINVKPFKFFGVIVNILLG